MISDAVKAIMSRGETIGYHSGYTEGEQSGYARGELSGFTKGEIKLMMKLLSRKFPGCSFEWISELDREKLSIIEDRFIDITFDEVMKFRASL